MRILFLLLFLSFLKLNAQPYDTAIAILQASKMSKTTKGSVQINLWVQDVNGGVYQFVNFPKSQSYRFDFTGRGGKYGKAHGVIVWSNLAIQIDGITKANLSINKNTPDIWSTVISIPSGRHKVSMLFTNDNGNVNFKLSMGLLYITPVNLPSSNQPVIYPLFITASLPAFDSAFITRENFASSQFRGFSVNRNNYYNNHQPEPLSAYDDLSRYGANLLRVFVELHNNDNHDYSFVTGELESADSILFKASQNHFYVNLVITEDTNKETFWGNTLLKASYVQRCAEVALRYKDHKEVACYSLINEPDIRGTLAEWCWLAQQSINAIRRIDTNHVIIYPTSTTSMDIFRYAEPAPFNNLVYEYHSYQPFQITHQGINLDDSVMTQYPNNLESTYIKPYGMTELENSLLLVDMFALKWHTPVYIGEFSCVAWAPNFSACRYIDDACSVFEARGYSWSYFAFRQYEAWDAEIPPEQFYKYQFVRGTPVIDKIYSLDQYRTDTTCTMQVLKKYFLLNSKN